MTIVIEILAGISIFLLGMIAYGYSAKSKLMESKTIAHAAYVDALTGLGNRFKFNKVINEKVLNQNKKFALCFLDLDDFKHINDNMGHDAGDELLIALAKRLEESLKDDGTVYRLGGDEYAMIIDTAGTKQQVEDIVKRVQKNVVMPIEVRGNKINLEYSLGISMFPDDATNADDLVNYADGAMYYIKESGKSNYYFHNSALRSQNDNKRRMERELKEAYKNKEFGVEYQPRVNRKNPEEIWLETFLYWKHPMVGKLRARYFIKYAEAIGLIIPIDEYVLKETVKTLKNLKQKGYHNVHMAINLSMRHFQRNDFIEELCNILDESGYEKNTISFQITNNIDISKIESYKVLFDKVKEKGIRISVNNFETKYDVMDVFNRLPIDEIKVSSEYLASNSIFNKYVLKDIINLSKNLNYDVVVTKVSDEKILQEVLKYDVDMLQGNHLFEVVEEEKLPNLLDKYNKYKGDIKKIIKSEKR